MLDRQAFKNVHDLRFDQANASIQRVDKENQEPEAKLQGPLGALASEGCMLRLTEDSPTGTGRGPLKRVDLHPANGARLTQTPTDCASGKPL